MTDTFLQPSGEIGEIPNLANSGEKIKWKFDVPNLNVSKCAETVISESCFPPTFYAEGYEGLGGRVVNENVARNNVNRILASDCGTYRGSLSSENCAGKWH